MKKNNRETGAKAEAIACWFLKQQGYDVLEQNFYTKVGEIDIIAKEDQTLVFVEVKYRKDDKKGYPAQAVDQRKQQKIRKLLPFFKVKHYLLCAVPARRKLLLRLRNAVASKPPKCNTEKADCEKTYQYDIFSADFHFHSGLFSLPVPFIA